MSRPLRSSPFRGAIWPVIAAATVPLWAACRFSDRGPAYTGRWGQVRLVEEVRIGAFEEPQEYVFGRVQDIAIGPELSIYVHDRQLVSVRQYAADGTFVRPIGAKGQGPGEYQRVQGIRVLPDHSIVILDAPHRVIVYEADGRYSHDFRVETQSFATQRMLEIDTFGHVYVKTLHAKFERRFTELPLTLTKLSVDGQVLDRIDLPRYASDGSGIFSVRTLHAWSPLGYLIVGRNDEYSLTLRDTSGDTVSVDRPFERVPVDPSERQEWQAFWDHRERQARERGQPVSYSSVAATKPVFRDLRVGDDGRIWVLRHVRSEKREVDPESSPHRGPVISWVEPTTYDVFEPNGEFLGTVVLPKETALRAMRGQHLWVVAQTDEGEQVVRLKVTSVRQ